jgi:hypothetical protein
MDLTCIKLGKPMWKLELPRAKVILLRRKLRDRPMNEVLFLKGEARRCREAAKSASSPTELSGLTSLAKHYEREATLAQRTCDTANNQPALRRSSAPFRPTNQDKALEL